MRYYERMGIFLRIFLIILTLTGPFFVVYGGYLLVYGKKTHRIKAVALIGGGLLAGLLAYLFNTLLASSLF